MCDLCSAAPGLTRRAFLVGAASAAALPLLPARSLVVDAPPSIDIRPRSDWAQGNEPVGELLPEDVRFLLVHHTAGRNEYGPDESAAEIRSAYEFHTGPDKGWADIAYNFMIDRYGVVWEGRAGSRAGPVMADATEGSQGFAQLVCLLGDFTAELPTPEALESMTVMLAWLADRYTIDTSPGATVEFVSRGSNLWPAGETVVARTISGHRDMSATACPGDAFYPVLRDDMQRRVSAARTVVATTTTTTNDTTGATTTVATSTPSNSSASTSRAATTTTTKSTAQSTPAPPTTVAATSTVVSTDSSRTVGWIVGGAGAAALAGAATWVIGRRHATSSSGDEAAPPTPEHNEG